MKEEKKSPCCDAKINWKESGVSQLSYDVEKTCSKCGKKLKLEHGDI